MLAAGHRGQIARGAAWAGLGCRPAAATDVQAPGRERPPLSHRSSWLHRTDAHRWASAGDQDRAASWQCHLARPERQALSLVGPVRRKPPSLQG